MTSTGLLADVAIGISEGNQQADGRAGQRTGRASRTADIFSAMNELADADQ